MFDTSKLGECLFGCTWISTTPAELGTTPGRSLRSTVMPPLPFSLDFHDFGHGISYGFKRCWADAEQNEEDDDVEPGIPGTNFPGKPNDSGWLRISADEWVEEKEEDNR